MSAEIVNRNCEDTITLCVQWEIQQNNENENSSGSGSTVQYGTAIYTASWIAPTSDVHSQQRFFYMGHKGK